MRVLALAAACLSLLGIASAADAATPVKGASPGHLHGFLLRADEPVADSFPRTPSFAWDPVPGAVRYQFQLSTSSSFRDSGLLYTATTLITPVAAPQLTLPWITGNPHALFARVRATRPQAMSSAKMRTEDRARTRRIKPLATSDHAAYKTDTGRGSIRRNSASRENRY